MSKVEEYLRELSRLNKITKNHCDYLYVLFKREGLDIDDFYDICEFVPFYNAMKNIRKGNHNDRISAAKTLGHSNDPRAVDLLIDSINNEKTASIREHSATGLGNIGDPRAVDHLINSMENDSDPYVREKSLVALAKIGDVRANQFIIHAAINEDSMNVKLAAIWALGEINDSRSIPTLINIFREFCDYTEENEDTGDSWLISGFVSEILEKLGIDAEEHC